MLGQWLDWSLDGQLPAASQGVFASGTYHLHAPGILELIPNQVSSAAHACIYSAAVHGNETAPVELVGEWLSGIEAGSVTLGAPVLVILGNLPALKAQQRFLTTNLNRLFNRDLDAEGEEPDRARELMTAVDNFYARHSALPSCTTTCIPPLGIADTPFRSGTLCRVTHQYSTVGLVSRRRHASSIASAPT
ncbi:hypothetical protein HSBAA_44390 [Vreelandella sulfidaeris]|uniref:Succinylglutamate desuccinylase/Aspartoacylase catalytic domain-containing protein n=1 Tax=Vreelandella sulfidaeris TaxID=115553 RepID=A0A455UCW0_9GAMM|nr:hypothetical protein HSBAA_44390 [Halomonas sulfidaeris]